MTALAGFVGIEQDEPAARALRRLAEDPRAMVAGDRWAIAAVGHPGLSPADDWLLEVREGQRVRGFVLGRLHVREGDLDRARRDPVGLASLRRDGLAGAAWGRYSAAAVDEDGALVLARDPIGLSTCFHAACGDGHAFATRLELLVELLGSRPPFDWPYLRSFALQGHPPTARTGFEGVAQLPPGTVLELREGRLESRQAWSAAAVIRRGHLAPPLEEVRSTLRGCTRAWVAGVPLVCLDLSGGLDSSSVCWAASQGVDAGGRLEARFVRFPEGAPVDESGYARAMAGHVGAPLRVIDGGELLPLTPPRRPLRRTDAPQLQLLEARLNEALAELSGPDAQTLSGGAGDQVFLARTGVPYHLEDHFRARGLAHGLRETAMESAAGAGSVPGLLAGIAAERWRLGTGRRDGLARVGLGFGRPPWMLPDGPPLAADLPAATGALPAGKARQALGIAYWAGSVDREHRNPHRPTIYPMLSLPLVELALRAPLHALIDRRGDRLLLRRAMAEMLPRAVAERRDKGAYIGMYHRALRRNFEVARELIAESQAAACGLLDQRLAMEDLRATALGCRRGPNWPLFSLLAVELWCRTWA